MSFDLVAFDLETTGIDPFTDVPVSYTLGEITELVNPGRPIPISAADIHGITDDMVVDAMPLMSSILTIAGLLEENWADGKILIGMNVSYDLTMMASLTELLFDASLEIGPVLDVLVIDRYFDKYRRGSRTLSSLCAYYGVELLDAHSSKADANACIDIFNIQMKEYPKLKSLPTKGNDVMRLMYREWLKGYSKYRVENGQEEIAKGRYEWPVHSKEI